LDVWFAFGSAKDELGGLFAAGRFAIEDPVKAIGRDSEA
jgi:hypothetical protein